MQKVKLHYFMMRQMTLAREIAEELGGADFTITFVQHYYASKASIKSEVINIDTTQMIFHENFCPSRKARIIVSMYFDGEYDKKTIDRLMHRWHKVIQSKEGFSITYSVNISSI